ncbi:unnamed protein product, partial [Nesidiocoris tenuis]
CASMNVIRDPYAGVGAPQTPRLAHHHVHYGDSRTLPATGRLQNRSLSTDSVYTILIRLPPDPDGVGSEQQPSIKMITDDIAPTTPLRAVTGGGIRTTRIENSTAGDYNLSLHPAGGYHHTTVNRRPSHISDIRIPLNAKIIPKQLAAAAATGIDLGRWRGQASSAGEEKEENAREEGRQESGEDIVGHLVDVHHHVDAVQHTRSAEADHSMHGLHTARLVGFLLLSLLHQQHDQSCLLRAVQRVIPAHIRTNPHVQMAQSQSYCDEPRILQLNCGMTKYDIKGK